MSAVSIALSVIDSGFMLYDHWCHIVTLTCWAVECRRIIEHGAECVSAGAPVVELIWGHLQLCCPMLFSFVPEIRNFSISDDVCYMEGCRLSSHGAQFTCVQLRVLHWSLFAVHFTYLLWCVPVCIHTKVRHFDVFCSFCVLHDGCRRRQNEWNPLCVFDTERC